MLTTLYLHRNLADGNLSNHSIRSFASLRHYHTFSRSFNALTVPTVYLFHTPSLSLTDPLKTRKLLQCEKASGHQIYPDPLPVINPLAMLPLGILVFPYCLQALTWCDGYNITFLCTRSLIFLHVIFAKTFSFAKCHIASQTHKTGFYSSFMCWTNSTLPVSFTVELCTQNC
jgi:hypothetical protein